jgi:hypothetical protein
MFENSTKILAIEWEFIKIVHQWNIQRHKIVGASTKTFQPLLHIVPFCEGPNKKPEGFAKQKQPAIFAMQHASQLVQHHPSLIYNVP